jgi:hypothetical protein
MILTLELLFATDQIKDPDAYSLEGYCIVNTIDQIVLGLDRFTTEEEFIKKCNGKMIFEFGQYICTNFISYGMHFPIQLNDFNKTYFLDINSSQKICAKRVIEELVE